MIYLRFAIADIRPSGQNQRGLAEFMFQSEDARDCTRRAATHLRERGHRPLGIDHAWEGFEAADFPAEPGILSLFEEAATEGFAVNVRFGEVPAEREAAIAPFALSYAAGR